MLKVSEARWAATIRHFTLDYKLQGTEATLYFKGDHPPGMILASQRLADLGGKIVEVYFSISLGKTVLRIKEPTLI